MDEVSFERLYDPAVENVNQTHKKVLDDALEKLKINPKIWVKLSVSGQNKDEQMKVFRSLNKSLNKLIQIDDTYKAIKCESECKENEQLSVFVKPRRPAKKALPTVKKEAKNNANKTEQKPEKHPVHGAPQTIPELKAAMLKSIEILPAQMLPNALAQQQGTLAEKQQKLTEPGLTEEAAGRLKEEIQMFQEVIEAIKKRMGN